MDTYFLECPFSRRMVHLPARSNPLSTIIRMTCTKRCSWCKGKMYLHPNQRTEATHNVFICAECRDREDTTKAAQ